MLSEISSFASALDPAVVLPFIGRLSSADASTSASEIEPVGSAGFGVADDLPAGTGACRRVAAKSLNPFAPAIAGAVDPDLSAKPGSAPALSSNATKSEFPLLAAIMSAVLPSSARESTSAP